MKTLIGIKDAYRQGYAAGKSGMGTDACCWLTDTGRGIAWFAGWRDGRNSK